MSQFRVAVTDYVFPDLQIAQEVLAEVGAELVAGQSKSAEEVNDVVRGADAVLNTYYGPIDGSVMDAMPDCRIIVRFGARVDTIDIPAATARGKLIDTAALVNALEQGLVSGVGLDVIEETPPLPADSPLLEFDNVILTPHSAWLSDEALPSLQRLGAMEVARVLRGERPKALLNREVLDEPSPFGGKARHLNKEERA